MRTTDDEKTFTMRPTMRATLFSTMTPPVLALLALAVTSVTSQTARARATYQTEIPNVPNACQTCHIDGGGSERNPFGQDVEVTRDRAVDAVTTVQWTKLWNVDSDGDGQTNGMELGDPCGEWSAGAPATRIEHISSPGNEDATSLSPLVGCTDGAVPPDDADPRPEQRHLLSLVDNGGTPNPFDVVTGCFGNQSSPVGDASMAALFIVLGALTWRRTEHRRRR